MYLNEIVALLGAFYTFSIRNTVLVSLIVLLSVFLAATFQAHKKLLSLYDNQQAIIIEDRHGLEIAIKPNPKGPFFPNKRQSL